jgi:hypothetical protein
MIYPKSFFSVSRFADCYLISFLFFQVAILERFSYQYCRAYLWLLLNYENMNYILTVSKCI